jgi:glutathione S-transferase
VETLTLVSHHLCPYVQRAAIALAEKGVAYDRVNVDLANKPDWFKALSPLGKTPVLQVGGTAIFESAVILEYLEETQPDPLHPRDPLRRAEHRSLIEFGSAILNDIWAFYSAPDANAFEAKRKQLAERFAWLERRLVAAPWFDGETFSLVDAVFAPVFRYFDAFDRIGDFGILTGLERMNRWRRNLAARPSVQTAVTADYDARLRQFLLARGSHLSRLMERADAAA